MTDGGNPLLAEWDGPLGAPPFARVRAEDFLPALKEGVAANRAEITAIAGNPEPATFDNTIAALERSGEVLGRVRRLFWTLSSAQADEGIRAVEGEVAALLTRHSTEISHDPALFGRIAAVWSARETSGLTAEQKRLVENSYKGFMRGGAGLDAQGKARIAAIDERLSALSVTFGQNVLASANAWEMVLKERDLDGLPAAVREAAGGRAGAKGMDGRYLFTLDRGDFEAFLGFSTRRDLRERVWRAFMARGDGGAHDNNPVIAEIVRLRQESARLLGYPTYAAYKLEDSMAATPEAAEGLMMRVWEPARRQAIEEAATLQAMIDAEGGGFALAPWDWRFYSERVRRERYAVDAAAISAHLTLAKVRTAAFHSAERLYGLSFLPRPDITGYHPDVSAFEVRGKGGVAAGLLFTDYHARPEKHGGAWMGSLRVQEKLDGPVLPIVYQVANFAKAPAGADTHVSLDEARTLFHEFGHALHALLSNVTYPSLAGTAVSRDFVEFPSKFMEHWITAPEVLRSFGLPDRLIDAIGRADAFGQGFATVEFLASAIVDLELHRTVDPPSDPAAFEAASLARLGMPAAIAMRHRLAHFTHVFDGGYASAYYSYLWAEVLEADAFAAFTERGDIFDPELAGRFRREVLAWGDARDPAESFRAFRGREPEEKALLEARQLVDA